jgi:hypothetical protein
MFGWLNKRLKGLVSSEHVIKFCDSSFETFAINTYGNELTSEFNQHYRDAFNVWKKDYFFVNIERIFSQTTRKQQMLGLREFVLRLASDWVSAEEYISKKYTDEERGIIADKLYYKETKARTDAGAEFCYLVNAAMAAMLRVIADTHFQDATKTDYFVYFLHTAQRHVSELYKVTIAKALGTSDAASIKLSEMLVDSTSMLKKHIWETAVSGGNFDFDAEREEKIRLQQEQDDRANTPRKREHIYAGEINQITEILAERYERALQGELYQVDGKGQSDALKFFHMDTALVLFALRECLQSELQAEESLREIIWQFYKQLTTEQTGSKEDIDIDFQRFVASKCGEWNQEGGWFLNFLGALRRYLEDDAQDESTKTRLQLKEHSRVGLQLGKDAWALYANVMNIFGWNINTTFLED